MTANDARFAELYEGFSRRLYGYCIRRTTPERVDDVVAETFLIAWRRIEDVPPGDDALPWLYGVAYKVLGNHWRTQKRRHKLEMKLVDIGITPVVSAEEQIVTGEEKRQVLEAVSNLKPTDREILKLAMWEEVSHPAIAEILGISRGAVKQRLFEARKNLTSEYNRLEKRRMSTPAAQKGGGQ